MNQRSKAPQLCDCVAKFQETLDEQGLDQEIVSVFRRMRGEFRAFAAVGTQRKMGSKKRGKMPTLICSYCPFCGVEYPDV